MSGEIEAMVFTECDTCRAKPGSPTLCSGCLANRNELDLARKIIRGPTPSAHYSSDALTQELARTRRMVCKLRTLLYNLLVFYENAPTPVGTIHAAKKAIKEADEL